ncbi:DUF3289 family protein [Bacteroides sp.]
MAGKEFAVKGAMCICKYGVTPGQLDTPENQFFKLNGSKLTATTKTVGSVFGPAGFGMCNVNPMLPRKCVPAITQWSGYYEGIKTSYGGNPLTDKSKATCSCGCPDCIEFVMSGQIPIPGVKDMQKATKEHQGELDCASSAKALSEHPVVLKSQFTVNSSPKVIVTKVNGDEKTYPGGNVVYTVVSYNTESPSPIVRSAVKWKIEVDGQPIECNQTGERLELTMKEDSAGKIITVMPYLNQPSQKVCVKTYIEEFRKCVFFARSMNWAGKTRAGTKAEDMMCNDKKPAELLAINKLFNIQLSSTVDQLFNDMAFLFSAGTLIDGNQNAKALIMHFRNNTGEVFSSSYMNEMMKRHPTFDKFVNSPDGVVDILKKKLRELNGNINKINGPLHNGEIKSVRVKFNTMEDKLKGMTLAVDDTSAYQIYVDNYTLHSKNTFSCQLRIVVYDHFGLDIRDVQKYGAIAGFRAWYVLQHIRGYKPFLTVMECIIPINNQSF